MFKKLILALSLFPSLALAQTAPTRPLGDNSNAIATTAFVSNATQTYVPSGTFSDFVHDDGAAINAALTAASNAGGGWVLLSSNKPFWANTSITIPKNVALGCAAPPQKQHTGSYTNDNCAIYLTPNNPITNNGTLLNARIYQDNIHFAGVPATAHALHTITANYSTTGTGVISATSDTIIQDVAIAGFNLDIQENSISRGQIRYVILEGANCLLYGLIGDFLKDEDIECYPFYSVSQPVSSYTANISNVTNNGSGAWRITLSSAPSEALVTGDEVYIGGTGGIGIPFGALGHHTNITVINSTTFDLTDAQVAPSITATTSTGSPYVTALSSLAGLWTNETFTGTCFTGTRTLSKLVPGNTALVADANATSTGSCTLTFASPAFAAGGSPQVSYDALGGQHGIGIEYGANANGVMASKMYVWGHDIAFQFDANVFGNQILLGAIDSFPNEFRNERTGILFKVGTFWNLFNGFTQTSGGVFVVNQSGMGDSISNVVTPGRVNGWTTGVIENDTGSVVVSGMLVSDNTAVEGQFNADSFNFAGNPLQFVNGTRLAVGTYFGTAFNPVGFTVDSGSSAGNSTTYANHLTLTNQSTGGAPSVSATGLDTNININLTPKGSGTVFTPSIFMNTAAPTVAAGQIGYGATTQAAGTATCPTGTVGGQTVQGCIIVNVAGTVRYVPFF